MELILAFIYFVALLASSYLFHRRYGYLKASALSGVVSSACAGLVIAISEKLEKFILSSFVGVIALAIIFGSILSAGLSALVGAVCQIQKK
jgi:hypothetical protein